MTSKIQSQNECSTFSLNNFKVKNGQKIEDITKNMTAEEKATVKLFDVNDNGIFDGKESDIFNTAVFNLSKGNINICLKDYENTEVVIKYSELESLKNTRIGKQELIIPFCYGRLGIRDTSIFSGDKRHENALGLYDIEKGVNKITFDYTNNFVQIDGNGKETGEAVFGVHADSIEINNFKPFRFTLHEQVKIAKLNNVSNPSFFAPGSKTHIEKISSNTEIIKTGNTKIQIEDREEIIKLENENSNNKK